MLLEIFKLETTMTIIHGSLSVLRMRHLRPRKAKGPMWGEAHTAGEGLTWIHHSAPLPRGVSLELFQACQAHLVSPSLRSCLSPPTLSPQVESGSCQQRERKAPEVRCEAKKRGTLCLPRPQSCVHFKQDLGDMVQRQPRNSNNGPWFHS